MSDPRLTPQRHLMPVELLDIYEKHALITQGVGYDKGMIAYHALSPSLTAETRMLLSIARQNVLDGGDIEDFQRVCQQIRGALTGNGVNP